MEIILDSGLCQSPPPPVLCVFIITIFEIQQFSAELGDRAWNIS